MWEACHLQALPHLHPLCADVHLNTADKDKLLFMWWNKAGKHVNFEL